MSADTPSTPVQIRSSSQNPDAASSDDSIDRDLLDETIEYIRPAVQADGGEISVIDVDEETGTVKVELMGACVGCPLSMVTLMDGVERILKSKVPGVEKVQAADAGEQETAPLISLG